MAKIKKVFAREILNSLGYPTVEVKVVLDDDYHGLASCASGVSIGKNEPLEVKDGDSNRFGGFGVLKAVENVNSVIAQKIVGLDPMEQKKLDEILINLAGDNKAKLGVNAVLPVSMAVCKAAAATQRKPLYLHIAELYNPQNQVKISLPTPMFNVVEGGRHGAGNLDFQEFLVIPSKVNSFDRAIQIGVEIYMSLKKTLTFKDAITSVGDEGGYAPNFYTNSDAFEVIEEAINQTRYKLGNDVFFGLDVAANTLRTGSFYRIKDRSSEMSVDEMIDFYQELIDRFRIISIEDPIFEDDWDGWVKITSKLGQQLIIVGDDLLVTNQKLVSRAIKSKAVNAMIAKLNQAGTVTETLDVIKLAKSANWQIVVSHRAGETDDDFIADLAVAVGADYAKFGAPSRGERVAKYNRLWEIFLVHSKNEH